LAALRSLAHRARLQILSYIRIPLIAQYLRSASSETHPTQFRPFKSGALGRLPHPADEPPPAQRLTIGHYKRGSVPFPSQNLFWSAYLRMPENRIDDGLHFSVFNIVATTENVYFGIRQMYLTLILSCTQS